MTIEEIKEDVKVLGKLEKAIADLDAQIEASERKVPWFDFGWMRRALLGEHGIIHARVTSTVREIDVEAMKLLKFFYEQKANELNTKLVRDE